MKTAHRLFYGGRIGVPAQPFGEYANQLRMIPQLLVVGKIPKLCNSHFFRSYTAIGTS